jgi:peptidoglycan/xylan/chitin deacetylase (PgdA/CDA1 family)
MDDDVPRLLCGTPELPPHSVALTFDDGPGPRSAELARVLRDEGVPATSAQRSARLRRRC